MNYVDLSKNELIDINGGGGFTCSKLLGKICGSVVEALDAVGDAMQGAFNAESEFTHQALRGI